MIMKLFRFTLLLSFVFSNICNIFSQDTINLLNGNQIIAKTVYEDSNNIFLKYDIKKRGKLKQKRVDKLDVFSIDFNNNRQSIIYRRDTILGYNLSINEMEKFIKGEHEAIKYSKAPWITATGVVVGFVPTAFYFNFYGLVTPVVYGTTIGIFNPKIKTSENINKELKADKNFQEGYNIAATRKRVKNALIGSVSGVVLAAITSNIIYLIKKK